MQLDHKNPYLALYQITPLTQKLESTLKYLSNPKNAIANGLQYKFHIIVAKQLKIGECIPTLKLEIEMLTPKTVDKLNSY